MLAVRFKYQLDNRIIDPLTAEDFALGWRVREQGWINGRVADLRFRPRQQAPGSGSSIPLTAAEREQAIMSQLRPLARLCAKSEKHTTGLITVSRTTSTRRACDRHHYAEPAQAAGLCSCGGHPSHR